MKIVCYISSKVRQIVRLPSKASILKLKNSVFVDSLLNLEEKNYKFYFCLGAVYFWNINSISFLIIINLNLRVGPLACSLWALLELCLCHFSFDDWRPGWSFIMKRLRKCDSLDGGPSTIYGSIKNLAWLASKTFIFAQHFDIHVLINRRRREVMRDKFLRFFINFTFRSSGFTKWMKDLFQILSWIVCLIVIKGWYQLPDLH